MEDPTMQHFLPNLFVINNILIHKYFFDVEVSQSISECV